jgi:hypothetical protein
LARVLRIDRALFMLLIGLVTAATGLAETVLPYYFTGPQPVLGALLGFVGTVSNLVVVYLSTEEQSLPPASS